MTQPDHPDLGGSPAGPKRRRWPWVLLAIVVAGVVVSVLLPEGKGSDTDRMVALCHKLVLGESPTPSTVTFLSSNIVVNAEGWMVSGEADGQNLFGAMVRDQYGCQVFYDQAKDMFSAALVTVVD